jgi:hypothetical protein
VAWPIQRAESLALGLIGFFILFGTLSGSEKKVPTLRTATINILHEAAFKEINIRNASNIIRENLFFIAKPN